MKRGELVPDALIARLVAELMAELKGPRVLLLDGFPRTVAQAQMLDRTIEDCGASLSAVVLLDVPDEILVNRIAGRRICPACGAGYHVTNIPPRWMASAMPAGAAEGAQGRQRDGENSWSSIRHRRCR